MLRKVALLISLIAFALNVNATGGLGDAWEADVLLNATYKTVMQKLPDDQRQSLRDAQRAWITYRDLACQFESSLVFSESDRGEQWINRNQGRNNCIKRLTFARLEQLQGYVELKSQEPDAPVCRIDGLPEDFAVEAVGIYEGGLDTDVRLESSPHETRVVEVSINHPGKNVVVVLMAYDPVLWQLKRTKQTHLSAVIVGGYHTQAVVGIERSIPLLISTYLGRKDCGDQYFYAYEAGRDLLKANTVVKGLAGKEIGQLWSQYTGSHISLGEPAQESAEWLMSDEYQPENYTSLPRFPSGQKGISRLIEMGLLRKATPADLDAWREKASVQYKKFDKDLKMGAPFRVGEAYVVLGEFTAPAGLYGRNHSHFLIPPGIPIPTGYYQFINLYFLEDGTCRSMSPLCGNER